jgi:hypothetical protein
MGKGRVIFPHCGTTVAPLLRHRQYKQGEKKECSLVAF